MMLGILLIVIAFICVAMLWTEGMWSNALTFVNVVFACMVSMNLYEPLANYFEKQAGSYTHVWDFLSLWAVFWLSFTIFRAVTDAVSTHQVRFRAPIEFGGRVFFAAATAWVFISFTCVSLHMAPLAQTAFRGSFAKQPLSNHFFGLAPDRLWLGFVHSRTKQDGPLAGRPFDEKGEFILKYGSRRKELEEHNQQEGTIGIGKKGR
jgi:hypothetical protein